MKRNNKKGFTLVELMIVIVVIGILAAIIIPSVTGAVDKANRQAALSNAQSILHTWSIEVPKTTNETNSKYIYKEGDTFKPIEDDKALEIAGEKIYFEDTTLNGLIIIENGVARFAGDNESIPTPEKTPNDTSVTFYEMTVVDNGIVTISEKTIEGTKTI